MLAHVKGQLSHTYPKVCTELTKLSTQTPIPSPCPAAALHRGEKDTGLGTQGQLGLPLGGVAAGCGFLGYN